MNNVSTFCFYFMLIFLLPCYINDSNNPVNHRLESVWKNGDDLIVLIRDGNSSYRQNQSFSWHIFENGAVGEKTDAPEDFNMHEPWADVPPNEVIYRGIINRTGSYVGPLFEEHHNNYPWQTQWEQYNVRYFRYYTRSDHMYGLWLTQQGENPILIAQGMYSSPVVIPDTDWLVCMKANMGGWANGSTLVRINLNTFEETLIDLPSRTWTRVTVIDGKILIYSGASYIYDVTSNTSERVESNFNFLTFIRGRPLQQSSEPGVYFVLSNQFTIGRFDINTYSLIEFARLDRTIYNNDHMWVDEENNIVYVVSGGNLISVPLSV